jgi:hypothetical protein
MHLPKQISLANQINLSKNDFPKATTRNATSQGNAFSKEMDPLKEIDPPKETDPPKEMDPPKEI